MIFFLLSKLTLASAHDAVPDFTQPVEYKGRLSGPWTLKTTVLLKSLLLIYGQILTRIATLWLWERSNCPSKLGKEHSFAAVHVGGCVTYLL